MVSNHQASNQMLRYSVKNYPALVKVSQTDIGLVEQLLRKKRNKITENKRKPNPTRLVINFYMCEENVFHIFLLLMTKLQIFMYLAKLYCIHCNIVLLVKASQTDIGQVVQQPNKTETKLCKRKENTTQLDSLPTCKIVEKSLSIFIVDDIKNTANQTLYYSAKNKKISMFCKLKPLKANEESKVNLKLKSYLHFQPKLY